MLLKFFPEEMQALSFPKAPPINQGLSQLPSGRAWEGQSTRCIFALNICGRPRETWEWGSNCRLQRSSHSRWVKAAGHPGRDRWKEGTVTHISVQVGTGNLFNLQTQPSSLSMLQRAAVSWGQPLGPHSRDVGLSGMVGPRNLHSLRGLAVVGRCSQRVSSCDLHRKL